MLERVEKIAIPLVLDIGCGGNKVKGTVGVDRIPIPGVDVVCDFERDRLPFEDRSVDQIHTNHTLEHIQDLERLLREFLRVLKPGGRLLVTVPHFTSTLAYSDYTHKRFFGLYTFDYFSDVRDPHWHVPKYVSDIRFRIESKRLHFRNWSIFGPVLEKIFNAGKRMQYIYESKLSWVMPCFEVSYELRA